MKGTNFKIYNYEHERIISLLSSKEKERASEYKKVLGYDSIQGFTQAEFDQSMKLQQSKCKSRTRRVYSKGNRWNANNLPRIKQNIL